MPRLLFFIFIVFQILSQFILVHHTHIYRFWTRNSHWNLVSDYIHILVSLIFFSDILVLTTGIRAHQSRRACRWSQHVHLLLWMPGRRIDNQGQMLEAISQQLSLLLADQWSNPSWDGSLRARSKQATRNLRHAEPNLDSEGVERMAEDQWGDNHTPRRLEVGRKLELPVLSSEDAYGWLARAERFF